MTALETHKTDIHSIPKHKNPLKRLYYWMLSWADSPYGPAALCVMAFAESSFFPIPPDPLLWALCLGKPRRSLRFAAYATIASTLGGLAGYAIGAWLWQSLSGWFFAYVPGFTPAVFQAVQSKYTAMGAIIVFTAGFSPLPYKVFTVASGVVGMPIVPFVMASVLSRGSRFFIEAYLLLRFGEPMQKFIDRYLNILSVAFCVLLVGGFVVIKWFVHP